MIYMSVFFVVAVKRNDNSLADIAWGMGFILIAFVALYLSGDINIRKALATLLVTAWGLRLSFHICMRNRKMGEDWRYKKMRKLWKETIFISSFVRIFLTQGIAMLIIAASVFYTNMRSPATSLNIFDFLGVILWLVGFFFETTGDLQLHRFKSNPKNKGKIMQEGLWRYTRHPNYFGESMMWWGIYLVALSVPYGSLTLFSPILITAMLFKVTGIPPLEKKYGQNPEYKEYIRKTNEFFPWFPRK